LIFSAAYSDIFRCGNLLDAIRFILENNTYQKNNATLSVLQEDIFVVIEQLRVCPPKMFQYLQEKFVKHFDIYLYIIAFDNGRFSLMNTINHDKKYTAFVTFNKDHTIRGPLFTMFENGVSSDIEKYFSYYICSYDIIWELFDILQMLMELRKPFFPLTT
jgi:hypothetical protein